VLKLYNIYMSVEQQYSADQNGYFGVTLLDIDIATADRASGSMQNALDRSSRISFDEASIGYNASKEALTVEGIAVSLSDPAFAIDSIYAYVHTARIINAAA